MTPNEQAIEAVARALWDDLESLMEPERNAVFGEAAALVAQITPLLTGPLQAKLDAAEAEKRQAVEWAAKICESHADDRPRISSMDYSDGYMDGCKNAAAAIRTGGQAMTAAPERIWIDFKAANRNFYAYAEPPEHDGQDCRDAFVREDVVDARVHAAHRAGYEAARADALAMGVGLLNYDAFMRRVGKQ